MDKHSSLLQTFLNYGRKNVYNIGPRNFVNLGARKTSYRHLRVWFVIMIVINIFQV
jgi:hypothetical protein